MKAAMAAAMATLWLPIPIQERPDCQCCQSRVLYRHWLQLHQLPLLSEAAAAGVLVLDVERYCRQEVIIYCMH